MAAGKPIVSFAGSGKGLVHRETAWLLDDGDVAGFADAAVRLLSEAPLAAALGERARDYVTQRCGWDRTAELVEQAYDQLLVEQRAHGGGLEGNPRCT